MRLLSLIDMHALKGNERIVRRTRPTAQEPLQLQLLEPRQPD
jgi:hypothetical protein